jgi:hypothetical protein
MKLSMVLGAAATFALSLSGAQAAVLASIPTTSLPADNFVGPSVVNGAFGTATGSQGGQYASPFGDNTSVYGYVQSGYVEYDFNTSSNVLSLVFGSPDSYNTITFLSGGSIVDTFNPAAAGLSSLSSYYVSIKANSFDAVQFSSTSPAFEFSNVSVSNVPLPASAPLFGAALVALGAAGYRLKRKAVAAA